MKKEYLKKVIKSIKDPTKLFDMGQKRQDYPIECCSKETKDKKYYPNVYIDLKGTSDFAKGINVGEKRKFIIEGLLKSKTISDNDRGSNSSMNIEIKKMGLE